MDELKNNLALALVLKNATECFSKDKELIEAYSTTNPEQLKA